MNSIHKSTFSRVESFSLSENFTYRMALWNHATNSRLKPLVARILGFACGAFVALGDFLIHAALSVCKSLIAVSILPFKCCFPIPQDLKLSSSFVHLIYAVRSLFQVAILPFACLLNPDRAYRICEHNRYEEVKIKEMEHALIAQKMDQIKAEFTSKEKTVESQRITLTDLGNKLERSEHSLHQENQTQIEKIKNLQNENDHLKDKIRNLKNNLPEIHSDESHENEIIANFQQQLQESNERCASIQEKSSKLIQMSMN
ncbi:MAG: hypothetical protein HWD61_14960 [Parachlamydiaceae bacterium]|nr:MAG: hypothetical protein HWD61_14960 [Parachlamydiaceae bacterium]